MQYAGHATSRQKKREFQPIQLPAKKNAGSSSATFLGFMQAKFNIQTVVWWLHNQNQTFSGLPYILNHGAHEAFKDRM